MSRFNVNISEFEQSSLSDNQIRELFANMEKKLLDLINVSQKSIKSMLRHHLDYRLITIGDNYVIVIRKSDTSSSSICIGYPFPIISKNLSGHISPKHKKQLQKHNQKTQFGKYDQTKKYENHPPPGELFLHKNPFAVMTLKHAFLSKIFCQINIGGKIPPMQN